MKKNVMMRVASIMLVLVLMSSSVISGTFAKYVTADNGEDEARVAKWGVVAFVDGTLFGGNYKAVENGNTIAASATGSVDVDTPNSDNIVAPGTKSDKNMIVGVSGTPEVKTRITIEVDTEDNYSDIYLNPKNYGVMVNVTTTTTADNYEGLYIPSGTGFVLATGYDSDTPYYRLTDVVDAWTGANDDYNRFVGDVYYPLVWTTNHTLGSTETFHNVADVATEVKGIPTGTGIYDANTDLAATAVGNISVAWEWYFESTLNDKLVDKCDTVLGNMMANTKLSERGAFVVYHDGTNYNLVQYTTNANGNTYALTQGGEILACLTVGFNATITATQVD